MKKGSLIIVMAIALSACGGRTVDNQVSTPDTAFKNATDTGGPGPLRDTVYHPGDTQSLKRKDVQ